MGNKCVELYHSCMGCFCNCCCCECNCLIFPSPYPTYSKEDNKYSQKISICQFIKNSNGFKIPYLKMQGSNDKKCLLYFHGNAQDIGTCAQFLLPLYNQTGISMYAVQYPTYGTYNEIKPYHISNRIKQDSIDFFNYILKAKGIKKENIIIFGRSIGSGPAAYVASRMKVKNLILMSPFSSIKSVASDFMSVGCLIKQHFDNIQSMEDYNGRVLIIHGKVDEVIAYKHGVKVHQAYCQRNKEKSTMISPAQMSHNYFNMKQDIVRPIITFLNQEQQSN